MIGLPGTRKKRRQGKEMERKKKEKKEPCIQREGNKSKGTEAKQPGVSHGHTKEDSVPRLSAWYAKGQDSVPRLSAWYAKGAGHQRSKRELGATAEKERKRTKGKKRRERKGGKEQQY